MNVKTKDPSGETGSKNAQNSDGAANGEKGKNDAGGGDDGAVGGDDGAGGGGSDDDDGKGKKKTEGAADDGAGGDDDDSGDDGAGGGSDDGDPDWRTEMAGDDKDLLKRLERFSSLADMGRSFKEAERLARAKGVSAPPAADAPLEEKAAFYTQHFGRPEKPEDITVEPSLPDGEQFREEEVTLLKGVLGLAHKSAVFGKDQLDAVAQIVTDMVVGGRKEMEKKAETARADTETALRKAWGKDYEQNLEFANAYAGMRCKQAGVDPNDLANLRLEDGSLLGDSVLWARVMALGGRDHAEDPLLNRGDDRTDDAGDIRKQLDAEMAKMNGSAAEKKEYATPAAAERRRKLRQALKRVGGAGGRARK